MKKKHKNVNKSKTNKKKTYTNVKTGIFHKIPKIQNKKKK